MRINIIIYVIDILKVEENLEIQFNLYPFVLSHKNK